jgi:hypothetical protein
LTEPVASHRLVQWISAKISLPFAGQKRGQLRDGSVSMVGRIMEARAWPASFEPNVRNRIGGACHAPIKFGRFVANHTKFGAEKNTPCLPFGPTFAWSDRLRIYHLVGDGL